MELHKLGKAQISVWMRLLLWNCCLYLIVKKIASFWHSWFRISRWVWGCEVCLYTDGLSRCWVLKQCEQCWRRRGTTDYLIGNWKQWYHSPNTIYGLFIWHVSYMIKRQWKTPDFSSRNYLRKKHSTVSNIPGTILPRIHTENNSYSHVISAVTHA